MDMSGLSLDQAPPYYSVQRFFLTAPLFSIFASLAIIFGGSDIFYSFINFKLIGLIHLITLGFITMNMMGAIQQMLPVLAGIKIKNPVIFSIFVHTGLTLGTALLAISYLFQIFQILPYAGIILFLSIALFAFYISYRLMYVGKTSDTIIAMRFAIAALIVVLFLGVYMLAWRSNLIGGPGFDILSAHVLWAFLGWVGILIMGVSFQVIPMFYVTPEYPRVIRKVVVPLIFSALVIYLMITIINFNDLKWVRKVIRLILYACFFFFSLATLGLLVKRKRKLHDPSLLFWKTAMLFIIICAALITMLEFYNGEYYSEMVMLAGMCAGFGFVFSLINGMLYKIVPFLSWFHLASKGVFEAPTMKDLLDDMWIKIQYVLHLIFLLCMVFTIFYPSLYFITGCSLFFSSLLLFTNLLSVINKYNIISRKHLSNNGA